MLKICVMTDNPNLPTGMARVGREIAMALHNAGHEVVYVAWYMQPPKPKQWPFKIVECENRFFGSNILDEVWREEQFDMLVTIGDMWRLDYIGDPKRCQTRRFFQWVAYTAIDGEPINGGIPKYLIPIFNAPDKLVAYVDYGKEAILKSLPWLEKDVDMIYHGVDPNTYFPMNPEQRMAVRKKYGVENKFVFLVVSRNQPRKNIPEIFKAWMKVTADKEAMPNARLWPHMNFTKETMGQSIDQLLETFGFTDRDDKNIMWMENVAHGQSGIHLPPDNIVNEIYNASDCLIMAGSEGFGLPILEAMAAKLPVITIDHSAGAELCAEGRGLKVPVAYTVTGVHMHERPFPDIQKLYEAMKTIYHDGALRESIKEKGYRFALQHSWTSKAEQWNKLINKMENPLTGDVYLKEVA